MMKKMKAYRMTHAEERENRNVCDTRRSKREKECV